LDRSELWTVIEMAAGLTEASFQELSAVVRF
jgi:hypothetical protein